MISFKETPGFNRDATLIMLSKEQITKRRFNFSNGKVSQEITILLKNKQFEAEKSQVFPIVLGNKLLLLLGLGKERDITPTALRDLVRQVLLSSYLKKCKDIEILPPDKNAQNICSIIEAVLIGTYQWDKYKTKDKKDKIPEVKNYIICSKKTPLFDNTIKISEGANFARNLVNENADEATSALLEKVIRKLVKNHKNCSLEVLNKKQLKAKGLNLHLAVNQGSNKEPKLIIVKYTGNKKSNKYTAIIGKGITYDSGGLNLKPSGHMETMRMDMSGTAAVIGVLKNALSLGIKKNIIFACAIAENAIGPNAYKPGDVIKSYSGKTVEIGNTDAEGRLVLADAISYVAKNYKPAEIIDLATLTGACIVALGYDYSGLVSTNDALAKKLIQSSKETDDRAWRLPNYPELKEAMKSKIADICNISNIKGGGTITAAEFLRQFTNDINWAHLDIAGTAWVDNQKRMYFGHGATGAGIRLLTNYLLKE